MAALLNRGDLLEELKFDATVAPADAYARFVCKIIKQSRLPRKILVRSSSGDFEILANKGKVAGFREFKAHALKWLRYPLSEAERRTLEALKLSAGAALKDGEISLAMISAKERAELAQLETPTGKKSRGSPSGTSKVLSLSEWKHGKNRKVTKVAVATSSVLTDFFADIKSKSKFSYLEDVPNGRVQQSGISSVIDESVPKALRPSFFKWRDAVSPVLGAAPILLTMRSPTINGCLIISAFDGCQYLFAEIESNYFGVVIGLWNKATQTK